MMEEELEARLAAGQQENAALLIRSKQLKQTLTVRSLPASASLRRSRVDSSGNQRGECITPPGLCQSWVCVHTALQGRAAVATCTPGSFSKR